MESFYHLKVECSCGSLNTKIVSTDEGIEVFSCEDCGDYFENDSFVQNPKRKVRKERDRFEDHEED